MFDAFDATFGEGTTETHTAGVWTSVTYNSADDITMLTHDDGDPGSDLIPSYMEGWFVQLNADLPVVRTVLSVGVDSITVSGNATSIAGAGDAYCIMHPPGVDVATGATQTDPCVKESRYLWAHGLYYAPVVGFYMFHEGVLDIHGAQPGPELGGQYYFWNRNYLPPKGRWITSDPARSPLSNLFSYVGQNPINGHDPSGLKEVDCGNWQKRKSGKSDKISVSFSDECCKTQIEDISKAICKAAKGIFYAWRKTYRAKEGIIAEGVVADEIDSWFGKGDDKSGEVEDMEGTISTVSDDLWDALKEIEDGITINCDVDAEAPGSTTQIGGITINYCHSDLKTDNKMDPEKLARLVTHELIHWGNWEIDDDSGYFLKGSWTGDDVSTDDKLDTADAFAHYIWDLVQRQVSLSAVTS